MKFPETGKERDYFIEQARQALDPTWVAPGVNRQLTALVDFETTATMITCFAPLLIPGLLQTADYVRAVFDDGTLTQSQVQAAINTRMGRQHILTREKPVKVIALIGENVLRRPLGGPDVMVAQLRYIRKMSRRKNITVQAVSSGPVFTPLDAGPCVLMEFAVAKPIVHFEHHRSSMFLPYERDVEDMQEAAKTVQKMAMSPEDTSRLIADIIEEMEHLLNDQSPVS